MAEVAKLFGKKPLSELDAQDGEAYKAAMKQRRLSPTTIARRLGSARCILQDAVRERLLSSNPWRTVTQRTGNVGARRVYVPVGDILRVIETAPNVYWRLLIALARLEAYVYHLRPYPCGGATSSGRKIGSRCPVRRHPTRASRIESFRCSRPYLEDLWEITPPGREYVFPDDWRWRSQGPNGWASANFRTTFEKIIRRAGVEPWPKLWHNLRASFEGDLATDFPLATVTKWLGNTPSIALRHYVDPTDKTFELAANWTPPGYPREKAFRNGTRSDAKSDARLTPKSMLQAPARNCNKSLDSTEVTLGYNVMSLTAILINLMQIVKSERTGFEPARGWTPLRI